jgi:hypothetical protein
MTEHEYLVDVAVHEWIVRFRPFMLLASYGDFSIWLEP